MAHATSDPVCEIWITWGREKTLLLLLLHHHWWDTIVGLLLLLLLFEPSSGLQLPLLAIVKKKSQGARQSDNDEHLNQPIVNVLVEKVVGDARHVLWRVVLVVRIPVVGFVLVGVLRIVCFDKVVEPLTQCSFGFGR